MPNKSAIVLEGHLGRDPDKRYTPSGTAVTKFSVAVGDGKWTPETKRWSHTTWFSCVAFGDLAERLAGEFGKGVSVRVEGRMVSKEHDGKVYWDVLVNSAGLCFEPEQRQQQTAAGQGVQDDELPF